MAPDPRRAGRASDLRLNAVGLAGGPGGVSRLKVMLGFPSLNTVTAGDRQHTMTAAPRRPHAGGAGGPARGAA